MAESSFDKDCLELFAALSVDDEALIDYVKGIVSQPDEDEDEKVEVVESILEGHGSFTRVSCGLCTIQLSSKLTTL